MKVKAFLQAGALLAVIISLGLIAFMTPSANAETGAFHDAANLQCNKCHTMHYSEGGQAPTNADSGGPFKKLLIKSEVTNLCLMCHSDPTKAPDVYEATVETPGGDFKYSTKEQGKTGDEAKGHNPGGVLGTDSVLTTAPGGTFDASTFTCISCHDEHGDTSQAFMYRNVLKKGLTTFAGDNEEAQIWDGSTANVAAEADTNHNVYKVSAIASDEFSAWCGSCHGDFHTKTKDNSGNWIRHPTAEELGGLASNYGTNYTPAYPVATTNANAAIGTNWAISGTTEGVMCLSCHKAHATNYANATRWDNGAASGSGTGCNKCHAKG